MKEKKNIDRIFQEKFKDFEEEPREEMWENISSRLDKKEKKKPLIIPLWLKVGGVAAILALIIASLVFTENQNLPSNDPGVVFEKPEKTEQDNKDSSQQQNPINNPSEEEVASETTSDHGNLDSNSVNNSNSNSGIVSTETEKEEYEVSKSKSSIVQREKVASGNSQKAYTSKNVKEELPITSEISKNEVSEAIVTNEKTQIDSSKTNSILKEAATENALAQIEEKNKKGTEEAIAAEGETKKMSLSTFAAPVFYKNIGGGNELSSQFSNNSSSSEVTLSYGVKFAYTIGKKLKIRTGISKVDVNYNIENISYSPSAMAVGFENIQPVQDNLNIRAGQSPDQDNLSGLPSNGFETNSLAATSSVSIPGEIQQQFGFIEVPLELEYALIDKKFGLNIIGGGSSLFLDNNRVNLISGDSKTELGEASNINSTSFSTNIGLGMDYKLTDKFSISVEPIFKYQLNTFNNVDNVQPINFGVYSGLNFRF